MIEIETMSSKLPNPFVRLRKLSDTTIEQFSKISKKSKQKRNFKDTKRIDGFSCELCQIVFRWKCDLASHVSRIHMGNSFKCNRPGCGKTIKYKRNLRRHERNHQDMDSGLKFNCIECGKIHVSRGNLQKHSYTCAAQPDNDGNSFMCYFCGKHLLSTEGVAEHLRLHTGEEPFKCLNPSCKFTFTTRNKFLLHGTKCPYGITSHSKYKCRLCQRQFHRHSELERHVAAVHTGERAFRCERPGCDKTFTWSGGLRQHLRGHLEKESGRSFPCNKCQNVFKRTGSLKWHRFHVHGSGRDGFACYFCNRISTQMISLTDHLRIHTKERPYNCPCCNKDFNVLSCLKVHLKRKH